MGLRIKLWKDRAMIFEKFKYVCCPPITGDMEADIKELLEQNGKGKTFVHVSEVAGVCAELAERFGVNKEKCILGGLLHDISAVLAPADMLNYAMENGWELCEAEHRYPFLMHQRISGIVAEEVFGVTDREILSAIVCHTTLKVEPTRYDMVLFLADKLAWDREGVPPFYNKVKNALEYSLEKACQEYMSYMIDNGMVLCPHTNWNRAYEYLEKWAK